MSDRWIKLRNGESYTQNVRRGDDIFSTVYFSALLAILAFIAAMIYGNIQSIQNNL